MNSWNIEEYKAMQMGMQPSIVPNMMMPTWCSTEANALANLPNMPAMHNTEPQPIIGPVLPADISLNTEEQVKNDVEKDNRRDRDSHRRNKRDDRDRRDRDRGRRSRSREHSNDRRSDSYKNRREKRSKWGTKEDNVGMSVDNVGGLGLPVMMPYNNMMQIMGQQQMNMLQMSNMDNMQGMVNVPANMMPNMIDPNMVVMTQQMPLIPNQPIYLTKGVLMPPMPGISMPNRREHPPGCRTIFVGGLPIDITEDTLNEMFQRFGAIEEVKIHKQGFCHVRFVSNQSVEQSFCLSGYRFKFHEQTDNQATTLFIDYALNRDDQNEFEDRQMKIETPVHIEPFTASNFNVVSEKIKSDEEFVKVAPTLAAWLERGECNKKNASTFYALVQSSNNQLRRLFNEKMLIEDEFQTMKSTIKDKFANIVQQFEQVAKILSAAKHQRVSDHFSKPQRRNIDMWLKMTEELENIKEEFHSTFDDDEVEKMGTNGVALEKYEALKLENENLSYELEGYKNEAHLAKDEAERKFETFKAHFIAQQALQNKQVYPPLPPPPPMPPVDSYPSVSILEAKLISVLTAFLMIQPFGATLKDICTYIRVIIPFATQRTVTEVLEKNKEIFRCTGFDANQKWTFIIFDAMKTKI